MSDVISDFRSLLAEGEPVMLRQYEFSDFVLAVIEQDKYTKEEKDRLALEISRLYPTIQDVSFKGSLLFLLSKIDQERAHAIALNDLKVAYEGMRSQSGYLFQILICIDNVDRVIDGGLSIMEIENMMKISYELLERQKLIK